MVSKINFYIFFINAIFLMAFFSCNQAPKIDDSKVFRLNRYENVSSLDPAFARSKSNNWMCNLIYTGLVNFDDSLHIVPEIAKKWNISPDGKKYTFTLRNDVYFQPNQVFGKDSTRLVVAEDFVYSFDRLKDPKIGSSGGFVLNNVESYKALNDSVLEIDLKQAFPPFLELLCMKYCSVVPHEIFDAGLDFNKNPVGTGPFQFQLWEDNVKLVLKKNPLFYLKDETGKKLPYLDFVSVKFLPEKHSEFLQLVQGKVDMLASLDPSYKDELLTPKGELQEKYKSSLEMIKAPYLNTEYLCFYLDGNESLAPELRKAINSAIDKDKMIMYLRNNIGFPANGGFIPQGLPGHSAKIGEGYNTQKSRALIADYKAKNKSLPSLKLVTTQEYADVCEFVQSELNKVGFPIQVNVVDPATLRDGKANGKFPFFRANWGADYPDAENFLALFYSKNLAPSGPNYSHFKNQKFDAFYEQAINTNDENERAKLYQKMDEILMQEMPVIPTFYDQSTTFLRKNVHGFTTSPINMLDLTRVWKD
ncbi:ABC transporter substrate-binding protein [Ornithobacterium rhinotracheale H06-030791]|nr:ABC transporter substrate-binding protein [Ornithobacterium rhinotracheale ORT-UMN 88]KGB66125.1 ABC transporter substrate-binding protein [Ornithobacterium rhinotracheale H06-030791]